MFANGYLKKYFNNYGKCKIYNYISNIAFYIDCYILYYILFKPKNMLVLLTSTG